MSDNSNKIISIGVDYEVASINIRERLTIDVASLETSLRDCSELNGVSESLILSTCNRTEIFAVCNDYRVLADWLSEMSGVGIDQLIRIVRVYEGFDAARHLFRVASGLESMVIGETQILGQLKQAFRQASDNRTLGTHLNRLFETAFFVAKDVRAKTEVGSHVISLGAAAVKVSERLFGDPSAERVLFIGAGEIIQLCAEYFSSRKFKSLTFANRTLSRAQALAKSFQGEWIQLGQVYEELMHFDVIISCTGSPTPIIGKGAVEAAISGRKHKPLLLIDLAVPRDVEAEVASLDDVFLFSIDDLQDIVQSNAQLRIRAISEAEKIIQDGVEKYKTAIERRRFSETVSAFRNYGEKIQKREIEKAIGSLARGVAPEKVVSDLARGITNKFLHQPSATLNGDNNSDTEELARALEKLYALHLMK